jgi:hypothetical protein
MAKASLDSIAIIDHAEAKPHEGVTDIIKLGGRGHALTIDNRWREVAETTLNFVSRLEPAKGVS